MKNINLINKCLIFIGMMLVASSCDDYLDINDNPNNPTQAPLAG